MAWCNMRWCCGRWFARADERPDIWVYTVSYIVRGTDRRTNGRRTDEKKLQLAAEAHFIGDYTNKHLPLTGGLCTQPDDNTLVDQIGYRSLCY